jgi:hypothetical protein
MSESDDVWGDDEWGVDITVDEWNDNNNPADMEAQDGEIFGENKI